MPTSTGDPQAQELIRIGMLTPSSNTVLEPVTSAMASQLPEVSVHFDRLRVTEISLDAPALGQFTDEPMLKAAELLADARVDVICWNATSAGWLGFDRDRHLVQAIRAHTGIKACSCVLSLLEVMAASRVRRYALVTPYISAVQARIIDNFAVAGYECVAERHLEVRDNFAFALVSEVTIESMIREAGAAAPDAIIVLCTNLRGGPLAVALEDELGLPIYDSVAAALWGALREAGIDARRVRGWGRLFEVDPSRGKV